MPDEGIIEKLKQAMLDLNDEEVSELLNEGVDAGVEPVSMLIDGLLPGLDLIGELIKERARAVSDMVMASAILIEAMEILCPAMEARGVATGDVMVIGNAEGGLHSNFVGKRIVAAAFTGAGYRVVDIGENVPASEFARTAKELEACIVAVSALGALKPQCKVINDALVEAGIRDDVIYIVGGWGVTEEWCESVGADAFGENAVDALDKVNAILNGDLPRWRDRAGE